MTQHVLIIDDEPDILQLLSITLSRMGLTTCCAENITQAKKLLKEQTFQLCLTDLRLPDGSGLTIVDALQRDRLITPVIVITAHGSMDTAVTAMKKGAFDFINKPVDIKYLRKLVNNALSTNDSKGDDDIPEIIGNADQTIELKQRINKVSRSQAPVLITGESGSGKELAARSIHNYSSRKEKPFIAVNCGAIPKELVESEFFGHLKGSFTGAVQDKQGLFQAAQGGTLFLDEIAELPLDMQVKLLRAIQEKQIRPIGSYEEQAIDVRILSATHQDLDTAVANNAFRRDLYYRINVIAIRVPPLRERVADIPLITAKLLTKIAATNHYPTLTVDKPVMDALLSYDFPGNIRELENILERAAALCEEETDERHIIDIDTLGLNDQIHSFDQNHRVQDRQSPNTDQSISTPTPTPTPTPTDQPNSQRMVAQRETRSYDPSQESLDHYLESIEKKIVLDALDQHRWNRTATAKFLGVSFRSLRYRLKKLGIDNDE